MKTSSAPAAFLVSKLHPLWTALLFLALCAVIYFYERALFSAAVGFDEQWYLWQGSLLLKKAIPYRDFPEPKPPIIFFANALGLSLGDISTGRFRWLPACVTSLALVFFFFALVRTKVGAAFAFVLSLHLALVMFNFHDSSLNDTESYGLSFTMAGFSFFRLAGSETKSRALLLAAGVFFALGVLSKEVFVFAAAPAFVLAGLMDGSWRPAMQRPLTMLYGSAAVIGAFLVYLIVTRSLVPYIEQMRFNTQFAAHYCVDIGRFPDVGPLGSLRTSWKVLSENYINFGWLYTLLPFYLAAGIRYRRSPIGLALLLGFGLALFGVSIGHCFWTHYYLIGTLGVMMPAIYGAAALSEWLRDRPASAGVAASCVVLGLGIHQALGPTRTAAEVGWAVPPPIGIEPDFAQAIRERTREGDYVLTTGYPGVYVATRRDNPLNTVRLTDEIIRYYPGTSDEERLSFLKAQLRSHIPTLIFVSRSFEDRTIRHVNSLILPFVKEYGYVRLSDRLWYRAQAKG
jgi:hypothetical protein